jgi:hypothetical protein
MKNIKVWMLILMVAFSNACTKDFESINTNPSRPEEVPLQNASIFRHFPGRSPDNTVPA